MDGNTNPLQPGSDGPSEAPAAREGTAAPLPDEAVRELAGFFAAEGFDPADLLLFCADVPGREQVMVAMADLRTQAS